MLAEAENDTACRLAGRSKRLAKAIADVRKRGVQGYFQGRICDKMMKDFFSSAFSDCSKSER